MANKEILILGAGPAGLSAAVELEKSGHQVKILSPAREVGYRSVYTTIGGEIGTTVRESLTDTFYPLNDFFLVTDEASVRVRGRGFGMVDYQKFIEQFHRRLRKTKIIKFSDNLPLPSIRDYPDHVRVSIGGETEQYDALIDCTGEAAVTGPRGDNPIVEYVYGGVFAGRLAQDEMVIPFVKSIGATCWANPSVKGQGYIDVVVSAWGRKQDAPRFITEGHQRLAFLRKFLARHGITASLVDKPEQIFWGTIRSQLPTTLGYQRVYSAGEAAGMARPKTGDGFRWAIYGGQMIAEAVGRGIAPDKSRKQFYTGDRARWKELFLQGAVLYKLPQQRNGCFGTSVGPLGRIMRKHPDLEEAGVNFFLNGGVDAKLLVVLLGDRHFRGAFMGAALAQLRFCIQGEKMIGGDYFFPKLVNDQTML